MSLGLTTTPTHPTCTRTRLPCAHWVNVEPCEPLEGLWNETWLGHQRALPLSMKPAWFIREQEVGGCFQRHTRPWGPPLVLWPLFQGTSHRIGGEGGEEWRDGWMVDMRGLCVWASFHFFRHRRSAVYIFTTKRAAEMGRPAAIICQWPGEYWLKSQQVVPDSTPGPCSWSLSLRFSFQFYCSQSN